MTATSEISMPSPTRTVVRGFRWSAWSYAAFIVLTLPPAAIRLGFSTEAAWGVKALAVTTAIVLAAGLFRASTTRQFSLAWAMFWLWSYIFLGLAPVHQIAFGTFPWHGVFSEQTVVVGLCVVLLGVAVAAAAELFTSRHKSGSQRADVGLEPTPLGISRMRGVLVGILAGYVIVAALFITITGTALFQGKQALQQQLLENADIPGAGTLFFIGTAGGIVLPAIAIMARRNGIRIPVWLIALVTVSAAIATNPLTGSRFLTGGFLVATIGALVVGRSISRLMPLGIGVALISIFPSLDLVRGDGTGSAGIALSLPSESLIGFDFDAFEMLLRAVSLAGDLPVGGPGPLLLFIAPFIRWVPFLSPLVSDMATGRVVAQATGASYHNLSMPLWGEAYVVGGVVGVIVAFAILGVVIGLIRPPAGTPMLRRYPTALIIDAPIAALLLIILRGSLYEVLGYALFTFAVAIALRWTSLSGAAAKRTAAPAPRPRTVAFYLPQFHTIPENDQWWGEGFTEWVNVRRAVPQHAGHSHPRAAGELGEYDLSDVEVMHEQAAMAQANGIDAFCFYFYWFDGKRLLERPLEQYLSAGPDMPFCISWANESWSRRWDGKEHEALITQEYTDLTPERVFEDFLPLLRDPRYMRVNGAAVLLVHRSDHLPAGTRYAETWRRLADAAGVGPLHLVAAETHPGIDPTASGFDAAAEFPPVGANTLSAAQLIPVKGVAADFRGRLMSYARLTRRFKRRPVPPFTRYRGVVPGWDNTARRGANATIYVGSTPACYHDWLTHARVTEQRLRGDDGLVFVNAWNEWAEGAYLEPDAHHGRSYLDATPWDAASPAVRRGVSSVGRPTYGWAHSVALAAAGSALQSARRMASVLSRRTHRG